MFSSHPATLDMAAIRVQHTLLLLRLLLDQDAPRIDLSRQVGLSRSVIGAIVADLLAVGLVEEGGVRASERVGRPATMLSLRPGAAYLLALDVGARQTRVAVLDLKLRVLASLEQAHDILSGPARTYAVLRDLATQVLDCAGVPERAVAAVGVGIPGPVDVVSGRVVRPPNMHGWDNEDVRARLSRLFAAPVLLDNDANIGALAEWRFGEFAGTPDLVYLKVATGIGAGVLLGGRLHRGMRGGAGEIGHISINEQGPLGRSGTPGSLESYAAADVLLARMRSRLERYPGTALCSGSGLGDLVRLAGSDPLAHLTIHEAGRHLGVAVSTLLNLFNPAAVIFGGPLASAGSPLLGAVREVVQERTLLVNREGVGLTVTRLGSDAGVLGAGVLALESLLSPAGLPHLYRVARPPPPRAAVGPPARAIQRPVAGPAPPAAPPAPFLSPRTPHTPLEEL